MHDNTQGGNNTLIAGAGGAIMVGDADAMFDHAIGGNNVLISGPRTDLMWGAPQMINGMPASPTAPTGDVGIGAHTFVFAPGNRNDSILDFRQSDHDRIEVT